MEKDGNKEVVDYGGQFGDGNIYEPEIIEDKAESSDETSAKTSGNNPKWLPPVRPLWMDLLIIVGVYLGTTIIIGLILGLLAGITSADQTTMTVIAQIIVYAITIPFSIWLMRKRGVRKMLSFSFKKADPLLILWGFILIFVLSVVLEPLLEIFPAEMLKNVNSVILDGGGWGMFMLVVLAPVCEEMLFRGIIQGGVAREHSPLRSILVASAIFAVIHLVPQQVINAFFCGLILGYVYYRTGSLIPVIIIHALNNAIAYIGVRMFPDNSSLTMRELISSDVWYWIVYAVCVVIFLLALLNLWKQLNKAEAVKKLPVE